MSKRNKIIYWVSTIWLALGMLSTGIVQLFNMKEEVAFIIGIGYPPYIIPFLGALKILGVIMLLAPNFTLLKEWVYAGFFFMMAGAAYSHIVLGNTISEIAPPLLLLTLTIVSWYFRPASRKIILANQ